MVKLSSETIKLTKRILNERKETNNLNEVEFLKKMFGKGKLPSFSKWSEDPAYADLLKLQRLPKSRQFPQLKDENILDDESPNFLGRDVKKKQSREFEKAIAARADKIEELMFSLKRSGAKALGLNSKSRKFVEAYKSAIYDKVKKRYRAYHNFIDKVNAAGAKSSKAYLAAMDKEKADFAKQQKQDAARAAERDASERYLAQREKERLEKEKRRKKNQKAAYDAAEKRRLGAIGRMFSDPGFGSRRV